MANLKELNIDYGDLKSFIKILKFGNYNHSILDLSYVVNFNLVGGKEYISFVLAPSNLLHSFIPYQISQLLPLVESYILVCKLTFKRNYFQPHTYYILYKVKWSKNKNM